MGLPLVWGATAAEVVRDLPADTLLPPGSMPMTRAVSVAAPVEVTWRRVCQLAVAPYSYDWLDNLGRRSPRGLVPGTETVRVGQRMATVFVVTGVDPPRSWTGTAGSWVAVSYAVDPDPLDPDPHHPSTSRLLCRLVAAAPGPLTRLRAHALAWGDLVMMRKQLHTLRDLAERDAAETQARGDR